MADPRDRRGALKAQTALNGIDFVEVVDQAQTQLRVHFLNVTPGLATLRGAIARATITNGDTIPTVAVDDIETGDWSTDGAGRPLLDLHVKTPGDFSIYVLALVATDPKHPALDRFFDHVGFTFKAGCPSTIDCEPPPHTCPPEPDGAPPIDYLAKDFDSFKRALLEFSAQRYPDWQERSEADFGVMFAEALASVADDLSYLQDRIAAEGWLDTATERRSLVRLARLVDYEPRVATAAHTMLQFRMELRGTIPCGTVVGALAADGSAVDFETGTDLGDTAERDVDPGWNDIDPWWFDDAERCLPRGATTMCVKRPARALEIGQQLVIETAGDSEADPPKRALVTLVGAVKETDALYNQPVTRITWRTDEALKSEHDLTRTKVHGNLIPATHGTRHVEKFVVPPAATTHAFANAFARTGIAGRPQFLYSFRASPLAWLAQEDPDEAPRPEVELVKTWPGEPDAWSWRRTLLGARPFEKLFTLDPMHYRALDREGTFVEYDGDGGETIRFGDGSQGAIPDAAMKFEVSYRVGGGARGNVPSGALTRIDPATRTAIGIISVTNPFAAEGGRDEESAAKVRELAPQRFRAKPLRAVRTDDYQRAAMTLPWVQSAGTRFRYTGSWLSVFTSVDPRNSESLPDEQTLALTELLDRRRLAGYESFALPPRYAAIDLDLTICVRPDAFRSDVEQAVLAVVGPTGFFHPDQFTFGDPLERSRLEAAVQEVPGVDGVVAVKYRRRGHTPGFVPMPDAVDVAADEIIRVANDRNRPERGSVHIDLRGGK